MKKKWKKAHILFKSIVEIVKSIVEIENKLQTVMHSKRLLEYDGVWPVNYERYPINLLNKLFTFIQYNSSISIAYMINNQLSNLNLFQS